MAALKPLLQQAEGDIACPGPSIKIYYFSIPVSDFSQGAGVGFVRRLKLRRPVAICYNQAGKLLTIFTKKFLGIDGYGFTPPLVR
jgi:hypothetical protein